MNIIMGSLQVIWLVIFLIGGYSYISAFDKIIKLEYQKHLKQWKKDGMPSGIFWGGMGSSRYTPFAEMSLKERLVSYLSSYRVFFVWLFLFPNWVDGNAELENLFHRYRILTIVFLGLAFVAIAFSHK